MKIGARVLKTGIAIILSIIASLSLIPGSNGMLAGIGAAYSTQPSVKKSFEIFVSRLVANAIGGAVAVAMALAIGSSPMAVGITAILTIAILNALKLDEVIGLAVVTIIVIMLGQGEDYNHVSAAILRVSETFIGVFITFLVNLLIHPPKYDAKFYQTLEYTNAETLIWIRASLRKNTEYSVMEGDLAWAQRQVYQLNHLLDLMHHEFSYSRATRYQRLRQTVVYRQMVKTVEASMQLLTVLHHHEYLYQAFPDAMRQSIRERVETLSSAHEQIILKFNGKVPPREVNFITMNESSRQTYLAHFFQQVQLKEDSLHPQQVNGIVHILSAIFHYEETLSSLNRLVRSYKLRQENPHHRIAMKDLS